MELGLHWALLMHACTMLNIYIDQLPILALSRHTVCNSLGSQQLDMRMKHRGRVPTGKLTRHR